MESNTMDVRDRITRRSWGLHRQIDVYPLKVDNRAQSQYNGKCLKYDERYYDVVLIIASFLSSLSRSGQQIVTVAVKERNAL